MFRPRRNRAPNDPPPINAVQISDDWGEEHERLDVAVCEYCNSPINRQGDAITTDQNHSDLVRQAVCRLTLKLWDRPDMAEAAYFRIVLGKTTGEIASKLGKSRQAINHLLVKAAKTWPELERMLFERKNETSNRKAMNKRKGK